MTTALTRPAAQLDRVRALPKDQNPAAVFLARLARGSRPAMLGALANIVALVTRMPRPEGAKWTQAEKLRMVTAFAWHDLRYQHTQAIRAAVVEAYPAIQSANLHISALRGVLKEAWKLGLIPVEEYHRAIALERVKGNTPLGGRALSRDEIARIFAACASDRDRALVAVLAGCGLRRAEVAGLKVGDYRDGKLTVRGKRNKTREVPMDKSARKYLEKWLATRTKGAAGPEGARTGDSLFGITAAGVLYVVQQLQKAAGLESLSPHDFRRTFITRLLDAGADALVVSTLAGHEKLDTTRRYDRRGDAARQAAIDAVDQPY